MTPTSPPTPSSASLLVLPTLVFGQPPSEIDTCSSALVIPWFWDPNGALPPKGITLSITNINVTQDGPLADITPIIPPQIIPSVTSGAVIETGTVSAAPGSSTPVQGIIEFLASAVDPSTQDSITWSQANLPQAWYVFLATATDAGDTLKGVGGIWTSWSETSDLFFVRNGSDTSCIGVPTSSGETSSGTAPAGTATGFSPNSIGSISVSKHVNRGAIAGGVIGVFAALAAVLSVYLCHRRGRHNSAARDVDGSPELSICKWDALGSVDPTNGGQSAEQSRSNDVDPVTVFNTVANSSPQKPSGFDLARSKDSPPSAFITKFKPSKRRGRRGRVNPTGTADSAAGMSSSLSSSSSVGHINLYANPSRMNTGETTGDFGSQGVPLPDLSLTSAPAQEEYPWHPPYPQSLPNSAGPLHSAAPVIGVIPIAYEPLPPFVCSPFVMPQPPDSTSRHSSRSYARTSATNTSSSARYFATFGAPDSVNFADFQANRTRAQLQNNSPTSSYPTHHSVDSPRAYFLYYSRASSPDAVVYRDALDDMSLGPDQSEPASES
ncbi:hypothetical protein BDP27DRAFT_1436939 [Rhodocollybia butyracea]|uniref:Uncharacterized protein n=1 Tax=Rhodocollybia butyracea TaxID=206335 RepID=A0A9P5P4C3_9AGAR|nr:hypothetical protein BDP27DRAFT_1436939 [Rhodocollybia butyracea]